MKLYFQQLLYWIRLLPVIGILLLPGCKNESGSVAPAVAPISQDLKIIVLTPQVVINDYVVVSSSRVGRTVSEYRLRAIATNTSSNTYTNVTATLTSAPANIAIVDGNVSFGTLQGNSTVTSTDDFVIRVDLTVQTTLDDLVWNITGDDGAPSGGGGGGAPEETGMFMSIDDNAVIRGDVTSRSHEDWIRLDAVNEGSSFLQDATRGGRLNLDGVVVTKSLDVSSPLLRRALADGDIFTEVKIDIIKSCGTALYTAYAITLGVSALSHMDMSSDAAGVSREQLRFDYSRIETMYTPVTRDCRIGTPVYSFQDVVR